MGVPIMPPDENLLPKIMKWFCWNARRLPVEIIRIIPPTIIRIIAFSW